MEDEKKIEGFEENRENQNNENEAPKAARPRVRTRITTGRTFDSNHEGTFMPEGFAPEMQNQQRQQYGGRQRYNNGGDYQQRGGYGQQRGGYQQRQQGGYQRGGYGQQRGGYQQRNNFQGGYQQNQGGYQRQDDFQQEQGEYQSQGGYQQNQGGYQRQGGYQQRQQGGYGQQRGGYNGPQRQQGGYNGPQRQGGYQQRQQGGYGQQRGGYNGPQRQQGGYNGPQRQGGYGQQRGGYGQQQRGGYNGPRRQHTADYDPNAKYSMKKRIEYAETNIDPNEPIRLNKYLANAGVCSRREADDFIQRGLVTVNGEVVTELGTKVKRSDEVSFNGAPVTIEKKVYVLLNKPKDCVTTVDDPQQRKTVMDLVKNACEERIYPVGRLDRNTTGVLLLTNDGELASKLTHPKYLKKKIYHVTLDKPVEAQDMQKISDGITLEDGEIKADEIQYADESDLRQVGIEIHSGKNRIVRRIFEHLGYRVVKLDRVQFAGLTKKNVKRGDWRYLTQKEVEMLQMGAFE